MEKEYGLYKYVSNSEVIYIGKTHSSIKNRIDAHASDPSFQQFLPCDVFTSVLANRAEVDGFEKLLIDKYKPVLNHTDKYAQSSSVQFDEPEWKPYAEYLKSKGLNVNLSGKKKRDMSEYYKMRREEEEKYAGFVENAVNILFNEHYAHIRKTILYSNVDKITVGSRFEDDWVYECFLNRLRERTVKSFTWKDRTFYYCVFNGISRNAKGEYWLSINRYMQRNQEYDVGQPSLKAHLDALRHEYILCNN